MGNSIRREINGGFTNLGERGILNGLNADSDELGTVSTIIRFLFNLYLTLSGRIR